MLADDIRFNLVGFLYLGISLRSGFVVSFFWVSGVSFSIVNNHHDEFSGSRPVGHSVQVYLHVSSPLLLLGSLDWCPSQKPSVISRSVEVVGKQHRGSARVRAAEYRGHRGPLRHAGMVVCVYENQSGKPISQSCKPPSRHAPTTRLS